MGSGMRAAALVLLVLCASCSSGGAFARVGQAAPGWTQLLASGGKLRLSSLRGKVVYLNFFATWCPPCNAEAPEINALQKRYAAAGLQVVGVDELESPAKARAFVEKYHLIYPAIVDDGTVGSQYRVNGLPVHVFIDRRGIVRRITVGEITAQALQSEMRSLLGQGGA